MLSTGSALALPAVCVPTDFVRDSHPLTAALINPPAGTVPQNFDATGCEIGIYYSSTMPGTPTGTLQNRHVFGARYYGIVVRGATASVTFTQGSVFDIEDDPTFNGSQHGVGFGVVEGGTLSVDQSQIYDYQKNGFVADGVGSTLNVSNSVVRGKGPTPLIAQNGIQFSRGADGSAVENFIEGHQYTGCSKQDSRDGSCEYVVSTGILLFDVDPSAINTHLNTFRDNDVNILNAQ
jgi:hypothetical protein